MDTDIHTDTQTHQTSPGRRSGHRGTARHMDTDIHTDTQTRRQIKHPPADTADTETYGYRHTHRHADTSNIPRQTQRTQRDRQTYSHTDRYADTQTRRETGIGRQTDRQTYTSNIPRQTQRTQRGRQTYRHTDTQTGKRAGGQAQAAAQTRTQRETYTCKTEDEQEQDAHTFRLQTYRRVAQTRRKTQMHMQVCRVVHKKRAEFRRLPFSESSLQAFDIVNTCRTIHSTSTKT